MREFSAIYHLCEEWDGVILCESENSANFHFGQVIFVKNGLAEIRTATVTHRIILIVAKADKTMKSKIP